MRKSNYSGCIVLVLVSAVDGAVLSPFYGWNVLYFCKILKNPVYLCVDSSIFV